jgi:hypothetical protein
MFLPAVSRTAASGVREKRSKGAAEDRGDTNVRNAGSKFGSRLRSAGERARARYY